MALTKFFSLTLLLFSLATPVAGAYQSQADTQAIAAEQEKAIKYYNALRRRPAAGYLFDRFFNTWLTTGTVTQLENYLTEQADLSQSTNERLLLAFFYAKTGDDVRSLEQFREALAKDPGNAATLYEKAIVEARTLDFDKALNDLVKARAANPTGELQIKIAKLQGKLLIKNRQNDEAIKIWQALMKLNPNDETLVEDIIELQIGEGLYDEAKRLSETLVAKTKDPYKKVVRRLRQGDILQRSGKREAALQMYGQTLGQVGIDTWLEREILGQIERIFRREDDLSGLNEHFKKLIAANKNRIAIRKAATKVQFELGMVDQAIKMFESIIELTPGDRKNRESFISLLTRAEKFEQATKQTEALLTQYPKDQELYISLAELQFRSGKKDESFSTINQFLDRSGNSEFAYMRAARLFEKFENVEKATQVYEKCIETFPDSVSAKETFAAFLYKNEKVESAKQIWKALAAGSDRSTLVRISRVASLRNEHEFAFELLKTRFEDFKLDTIFLEQLCSESIFLKKFNEASPWVQTRIRLTKTPSELNSSLGQAIQIIGKSDNVEATIRELENRTTRNTPGTCLLAELYERSGDSSKADDLLTSSLTEAVSQNLAANDIQMLAAQRVRAFSNRQDWDAAKDAARKLVQLPGGNKSVNVRRVVELALRSGDLDTALEWASKWKKISPGSLMPWFTESQTYERMGKFEEALNSLRLAAQKFPNDQDLFAKLASRYIQNGQYQDAERIYWQRFEESEKLADKLRWSEQLANLLDDLGRIDELISKFEERRRTNPKSAEPILALAQIHRIADNYEERRQALLDATQLQKDSLPLLAEIARLEESEGDWEKAVQTLEQAALLDKTSRSREKIARIYIKYGELTEGFSRLLDVAGGNNASARDVEDIANAIVDTKDWEQTRQFLANQIVRFPDDFRLNYMLAVATEELFEGNQAAELYIKLLSNQKEIRDLPKSTNATANFLLDRTQAMNSFLPPAAIEIVQLATTQGIAYSHQQGRQYSFVGSAQGIFLPQTPDQCRMFALSHLIGIASDMEDDERELLKERIKNAGVTDVKIMFDPDLNLFPSMEGVDELVKNHPESETALAIGVLAFASEESVVPETGIRAYKTFKDKYPELAFMGALQAATADAEFASTLDEAFALLGTNPPSEMALSMLARLVSLGRQGGESQLKESQIAKVNDLLIQWYPKIKASPNMGDWMFSYVASALKTNDSPEKFIEFLDQEISRAKNQPKQLSGMMFRYSYGQGDTGIQLASFPPDSLVNFPENVLGLFQFDEDDFSMTPFGDSEEIDWVKTYGPHVDRAKDPVFKALLQIKVAIESDLENEEDVFSDAKATIENSLKSPKPNPDLIYLASSIKAYEQNWSEAADYLEKMRNLPLSREWRTKIDKNLVALATLGAITDLESEANQPVLASAKSAALRLQRLKLPPDERVELVAVFQTLGLNKEAEKMENKINQLSGMASNFPQMFSGGRNPRRISPERIAKLVDAGKTDAAARLFVQRFNGLAKLELDLRTVQQNRWELDQLISEIKSLDLVDEFQASIAPGESASINKLSFYGLSQEMFGDREKAKATYQKVLEQNSKLDAVRIRIMLLDLKNNPNAFAQQFEKIQPKNRGLAGQTVTQFLNSDFGDVFEKSLIVPEQIISYLEASKDLGTDPEWLTGLTEYLAKQHELEKSNDSLPSLYALPIDRPAPKLKANSKQTKGRTRTEIDNERRRLHDQLAKMMIGIPEVAAEGFIALLASHEARGAIDELDFVALAEKAIEPALSKKKQSSASSMARRFISLRGNRWDDYSSVKNVPKRSPIEFLAKAFGESPNDESEKIKELSAKLKSARSNDLANTLQSNFELYQATPDTFFETVKTHIQPDNKTNRRNSFSKAALVTNAIFIWKDRGAPADIGELVINSIDPKNPDIYEDAQYIVAYAAGLAEIGKKNSIKPFLSSLRTKMLGSEEEQQAAQKLIEELRSKGPSRIRNSRKLRGYFVYSQLLEALMGDNQTLFFAMKEIQNLSLPGQNANRNISYRISEQFSQFLGRPQQALDWLRNSTFLGDLDSFDPLKLESSAEATVWGSSLFDITDYGGSELAKSVAKILREQKSLTFGEDLLLLGLEQEYQVSSDKILNFFGKYLDEIKALSQEKQNLLCMFASQLLENASEYNERPPNAKGLLAKKFIATTMGSSIESDLQMLLDAKRISDLKLKDDDVMQWTIRILQNMDRSDTQQMVNLIAKVSSWIEPIKNNSNYAYRYSEGSLSSNLVEAVGEVDSDWEYVKLVHAMAASEKPTKFSIDASISRQLQAIFVSKMNEPGKDIEKVRNPKLIKARLIDGLTKELGREFGDVDISVFIPQFQAMLYRFDEEELNYVKEWATLESKSGKYKTIASNWKLAVENGIPRFVFAKAKEKAESDELPIPTMDRLSEYSEAQASILKLVNDESKPIAWRLPNATTLLGDQSLPVTGVWQCTKIISEALKNEITIADSDMATALVAIVDSKAAADFETNAKEFGSRWITSRLSRQRGGYSRSPSQNLEIIKAVELFALTDQKSVVSKIIQTYDYNLSNSLAIATLLKYGMDQQAKALCRKIWDVYPSNYSYGTEIAEFTPELKQAVPRFANVFNDESDKLLARIYLSSFPDPKEKSSVTSPDRETRLGQLAEAYSSVKFKSKSTRELILAILSKSETAYPIISEEIKNYAKDVKPDQLIDTSNGNRNFQKKQLLVASYLGHEVQQRNFEPLTTFFESIETEEQNEWEIRNMLTAINSVVSDKFVELIRSSTSDQIDEIVTVLDSLQREDLKSANFGGEIVAMAYLLSGKTDSLIAKYESQAEKQGDEFFANVDSDDLITNLQEYFEDQTAPLSDTERLDVVKNTWRLCSKGRFTVGSGHFRQGIQESCSSCSKAKFGLEAFVEAKLLTTDELANYGPELAEIESVDGEIWRQVGRQQVKLGKYDQAVSSYAKSLEATTKELAQARTNRSVEYAEALIKTNAYTKAEKALENVQAQQLLGDNTAKFQELKALIKTKQQD